MGEWVEVRRVARTPEERRSLWSFIQSEYPDLANLLDAPTFRSMHRRFDGSTAIEKKVVEHWQREQAQEHA